MAGSSTALSAYTQCLLCLLVITSPGSNHAARILGIFPVPATSHMNVNAALVKGLAARGHQMTILSPFPEKEAKPNYTDIAIQRIPLDVLLQSSGKEMKNVLEMKELNFVENMIFMWNVGNILCDNVLQDPALQKFISNYADYQFDVIIMEFFYSDCLLGFAHKFKVPVVQVSTFAGTEDLGDLVGNPNPYAYVPDAFLEFGDKMDFKQRFINTISGIMQHIGARFFYTPIQDAIMRQHFHDSDMPSILELRKSTSLVLVNHHFSIGYPKPLVPNLVQVGGMHVKAPKELPADIKKFMDESSDGVIYFSMGSNIQCSFMKDSTIKSFVEAFSRFKQRVLWKCEKDTLPGQPANLKLRAWFPQSDVLAHPNVRVFISHGGLLGTQETIARGVPVIGIPAFGDQRLNMARTVSAGLGLILEYENITTESVVWALTEILENPKYHENAQRLSRIYHDQPLSPLQTAVFWTEYVIRHQGAPHMRSAALDLAWYQYFLLDVIAVVMLALGAFLTVIFFISRAVLRKIFGGKNTEMTRKKKD